MRPSAHLINTIRRLNEKSTVLMVNHCDRTDPTSVFSLAQSAGEPFCYLSARELFDLDFGIRGLLMQGCGAYSVTRGFPEDKESKDATISLIAEGKHKLIMFPEGDVTGRDDDILPLKQDGLRNIFEAQRKKLSEADPQPVCLLPIALYYEAQDDAIDALQNCLALMERRLELVAQDYALEARIDRVLTAVISHFESFYNIERLAGASSQARLRKICKHATLAVAQYAQVPADQNESEDVLLYSVRGAVRKLPPLDHFYGCNFCDGLNKERAQRVKPCELELERLQQLLIISSTLGEKYFTLDLAWRLVDRLEQLVLGKTSPKGHRIVWMECADPILVSDYFAEYENNSTKAAQRIEQEVRKSLVSTLQRLKRLAEVVHGAPSKF